MSKRSRLMVSATLGKDKTANGAGAPVPSKSKTVIPRLETRTAPSEPKQRQSRTIIVPVAAVPPGTSTHDSKGNGAGDPVVTTKTTAKLPSTVPPEASTSGFEKVSSWLGLQKPNQTKNSPPKRQAAENKESHRRRLSYTPKKATKNESTIVSPLARQPTDVLAADVTPQVLDPVTSAPKRVTENESTIVSPLARQPTDVLAADVTPQVLDPVTSTPKRVTENESTIVSPLARQPTDVLAADVTPPVLAHSFNSTASLILTVFDDVVPQLLTNPPEGAIIIGENTSLTFIDETPHTFGDNIPIILNEDATPLENNSDTPDKEGNNRPAEELPQPGKRKRSASRTSPNESVRKRSRNPALWKSSIRKTNKNLGLEYTDTKGKLVEAAKMRPPCACSLDCVHRVSQAERQRNFETFWALGDHERQWDFIRRHAIQSPTKENPREKKRKVFRNYYLTVAGKLIKVCKTMFMATLDIWDCWIDSAFSHLNQAKGNTVSPDKRGKHSNHFKAVTPEKLKTVQEHISSFPRKPSHYCRQRSNREYLERGLSIQKMAKLYQKWAQDKGLPKSSTATIRQYRDILNSNFNIGFFKPKKDQCSLCTIMRTAKNKEIKEKYKNQYVSHIKRKQLVKKIKLQDRNEAIKNKSVAVVSFDLQKQLTCPKSEVSDFFYRNKLSVFNFTTFHEIERIGRCYLWHEGVAKKGSDEVSSAVFMCIKSLVDKGYSDIRLYSDNCGGQNKNRFVFGMYEYAAVLFGVKITHRFLEPGHTHMDADTIHARIEKSTDGKEIMDFEEWVLAIEEAKEELPKYEVTRLNRHNIVTFKPLVAKQNFKSDLKGNKINWKQVREVSVNGLEGNLIKIKYDLDGEIVTVSPNLVGRPVNLKTYEPPAAYGSRIPLSANTKRDLEWLCEKQAIPQHKQHFFRNVIDNVDTDNEDNESEVAYDSNEELCEGEDLLEEMEINNSNERAEEENEDDPLEEES